MAFEKSYPHRKDHRCSYPDKKRRNDPSCRSHGNCPACARARQVKMERRNGVEVVLNQMVKSELEAGVYDVVPDVYGKE